MFRFNVRMPSELPSGYSGIRRLDKKGMIQCCDSSTCDYQPCEIEIKISNKKKMVIDWDGGAPKRFGKFAKMIGRVYKPGKWITLKNITYSKL